MPRLIVLCAGCRFVLAITAAQKPVGRKLRQPHENSKVISKISIEYSSLHKAQAELAHVTRLTTMEN